MGGNKEEGGLGGGGGRALVRCPRHPHEQSLVGICPCCLRDRLTVLAQLRQAEEERELSRLRLLHQLHRPLQQQIANRLSSPSPMILRHASPPSPHKTRPVDHLHALSRKQDTKRYEFPQAVPENGELIFPSGSHRRSLSVPDRRNYSSDGDKSLRPPPSHDSATASAKLKKKPSFWASLFHRENSNRRKSRVAIAEAEAGRRSSTTSRDNPEVIIEEEFFQTEETYEYVEVDQSHRSSSSSASSSWVPYILLMWRRKQNRYGKEDPPSLQESNRSSVDAMADRRPSIKQHRRSIFRRHGVLLHHAEESTTYPSDNIATADTQINGHLSDSHVTRKSRHADINPLHHPPPKHHHRHSRAIRPEAYQSEDDSMKTFKSTWNKAFSPSFKCRHSKEGEETEEEAEEEDYNVEGSIPSTNLHHFHRHRHHHHQHLQGCPLSPTQGSKSLHPSFLNRDYSAFSFYFSPGREPVSGLQKSNNAHHCSPYTSDGGGSSKATPLHRMKRSTSRKP